MSRDETVRTTRFYNRPKYSSKGGTNGISNINKYLTTIKMAMVYINKTFTGKDIENRFLQACDRGDISTVNKILRLNVSPNTKDDLGKSVLARASQGGHAEIVRMLIEAGADVNYKMSGMVSSLHLAAKGCHIDVVKHLVINGAKLDAKTTAGLIPIDFVKHESELWTIMNDASKGDLPEIEEIPDVPEIPDYALPEGAEPKKGKKKGKKGKKGAKKGGKKKGGKKKGGKKKKKK